MNFREEVRGVLEQMREDEVLTEGSNVHDNKTYMKHINKCLDKTTDQIHALYKKKWLEMIDFIIDVNEMGVYFSRRIEEIVSCKYCMPSDSKREFLLKEFLEQMELLRAELRKGVEG